MNREYLLYQIEYSYNFEYMFSKITWRIDKLISLILLILGSAVFSGVKGVFLFGLAVAVLTAIQMTYQYAKSSEHSLAQSRAYMKLLMTESRFSDEELLNKFIELADSDRKPWLILADLAMIRTNIRRSVNKNKDPQLGKWEKFVGWFAGDLPKR